MRINIINILKDIFAEVLLCPKDDLNLNKSYVDFGVDSILAIQISKLIKLKIGKEISSSDLYNFISINNLAQFLEQDIVIKPADNLKTPDVTVTSQELNKEDKIAIIGIAGRFPEADNVQRYWENLLSGKSSIITTTRWENSSDKPYKAGLLNNIEDFDADFFNISPREALLIDPQQRLLMEVAWQAFEDAGLSLNKLNNSKCGVFTTSLPGDYKYNFNDKAQLYNNFSFLGNSVSVLSGRISHFFNLKGPAIHVDTACSSSLVIVDLATKYLQNGSCDTILVGASCIFSTPELFELAEASNLLSKSGFSRTFDHNADGFVPAETVACLILRRLSDAVKDHQQIYGIIEGSQVNHDGYTNGLMSPSSHSQKELIIDSYKKYNIDILKIGYIEAHGTGTKLGDPIEVKALRESFEQFNANYNCFLGSSKTNIGHSLVASGMASIIKVLLSFRYEAIAPHLHFDKLNPEINLGNFIINTTPQRWPTDKNLAVVSAFGFSGTNAHVILRKPEIKAKLDRVKPIYQFDAKPYWIKLDSNKICRTHKQLTMNIEKKSSVTEENYDFKKNLIINKLKKRLSEILDYNLPDIADDKALYNYGIDSIIALQLLEPFKKELGEINADLVFKSKHINDLADHLILLYTNKNLKPSTSNYDRLLLNILNEFSFKQIINNDIEWLIFGQPKNKTLIFLPPLNTLAHIWIQQLRFFVRESQYQIFIPHYPGHGKSVYKTDNLEQIARNMLDSFNEISNDCMHFNVVGWSIGGCLSLIISYLVPHKVTKMVLVNTAAKFEMDVFAQSIYLRKELSLQADYLADLYKENLTNIIDYISAGCSLDILKHYYDQLQGFNILNKLPTLIQKCLIIYGKNDSVIDLHDINNLKKIPGSLVVKFDNQGHFVPLTIPFKFNKLVELFLLTGEIR